MTLAGISNLQEEFAGRGERVLLLAKKIIPSTTIDKEILSDPVQLEERLIALNVELIVVGLVAMVDPPGNDTKETVRVCRRAGIRFAMVTGTNMTMTAWYCTDITIEGDFAITATAIARQVGIVTTSPSELKHLDALPKNLPLDSILSYNADKDPDDAFTSLVISGSEMMTMTESQWRQALAVHILVDLTVRSLSDVSPLQFDEIVFARTSPQQKLQVVRAFQGAGCTVAVTGDGGQSLLQCLLLAF